MCREEGRGWESTVGKTKRDEIGEAESGRVRENQHRT